jgi:iron complex transport system permease protein
MLTKQNKMSTMLLGGLLGSILLCAADMLARGAAQTELPISIFTSLVGAPFLIWLIFRERRQI